MRNSFIIAVTLLLAGCGSGDSSNRPGYEAEHTDAIFHYSVMKALDNGVLEGYMTVGELKKHGDFGLGTYSGDNGRVLVPGVYRRYQHDRSPPSFHF